MERPRPTITSSNQYQAFIHQAQTFAKHFACQQDVVGVLATGGLARGYTDHYSELDLAIYLLPSTFEDWIYHGKAPFPEGDAYMDGWHIDFEYLNYEDELVCEWEDIKRWDRSYAIILYDPLKKMEDMLKRKAVLTAEDKERLSGCHLVLYGEYFCNLVVPSWLHRGDILAAHHCLNIALENLVKAVFLVNDELIPFEKWSLNLSYTLELLPDNWRERVEEVTLVTEISPGEVKRRCMLLSELFEECKMKLVPRSRHNLGVVEARKLEVLSHLREQGMISAVDFDQRFGLRKAIQSPLFYLLRREIHGGEDWLIFDQARFQAFSQEDFAEFLQWDRELLRALNV